MLPIIGKQNGAQCLWHPFSATFPKSGPVPTHQLLLFYGTILFFLRTYCIAGLPNATPSCLSLQSTGITGTCRHAQSVL
jgi:hypothetical protein